MKKFLRDLAEKLEYERWLTRNVAPRNVAVQAPAAPAVQEPVRTSNASTQTSPPEMIDAGVFLI
jgi:hypothetical protein